MRKVEPNRASDNAQPLATALEGQPHCTGTGQSIAVGLGNVDRPSKVARIANTKEADQKESGGSKDSGAEGPGLAFAEPLGVQGADAQSEMGDLRSQEAAAFARARQAVENHDIAVAREAQEEEEERAKEKACREEEERKFDALYEDFQREQALRKQEALRQEEEAMRQLKAKEEEADGKKDEEQEALNESQDKLAVLREAVASLPEPEATSLNLTHSEGAQALSAGAAQAGEEHQTPLVRPDHDVAASSSGADAVRQMQTGTTAVSAEGVAQLAEPAAAMEPAAAASRLGAQHSQDILHCYREIF